MNFRGVFATVVRAAIAVGGLAAIIPACTSHISSDPAVGSVDMSLTLPDNTTIDTVHYSITGMGGYLNQGDITVANSPSIAFQVGNIPAANGYSITLTATTSANAMCKAGPASFDVQAGGTTLVNMTLHCGGGTVPSTSGNVRVNVDVQQDPACPEVDGLTAGPLPIIVGHTISLSAHATTSDAAFSWSVAPASGGTFSPTTGASTTFTATEVGSHDITVHVTGAASCPESTATVAITIAPEGGGTGGTGTGGTGTGGTGTGGTGTGGTGTGGTGTGGTGTGGTGTGGIGGGTGGTGTGGMDGTGGMGTGGMDGTGGMGTGGTGTGGIGGGTGGTGTGGIGGGTGGTGGGSGCDACRQTNCTDYQGSGINLVSGCFTKVDGTYGADPSDPTFIQNCVDVVNCAFANNCAYDAQGASTCYCGTGVTPDACVNNGPDTSAATGGKCIPQVQAACRSTVNADIQNRMSDFAYPMGWAYFLLECDRTLCNSAPGKCTP